MFNEHDFAHTVADLMASKILNEIRKDKEKGIRQLIETAKNYFNGQIVEEYVTKLEPILEDPFGVYHRMLDHLLEGADNSHIKRFAINIGLNVLTNGSKLIGEQEERFGFYIPWYIRYDFDPSEPFLLKTKDFDRILAMSEKIGIFSHLMWFQHPDFLVEDACTIAENHSMSQFFFFLQPWHLTLEVVTRLKEVKNVFVLLCADHLPTFNEAIMKLKQTKTLFGAYLDTPKSMNISLEDYTKRMKNLKVTLLLLNSPTLKTEEFTTPYLLKEQDPVLLVDFKGALKSIDSEITKGSYPVLIDGNGRLQGEDGKSMSILNHSLLVALKSIMPKTIGMDE